MLTEAQRQAAAENLKRADETGTVNPQPSQTYPTMTQEASYDVQRRWAKARIAGGARIIGRKIGLTSRAMPLASKMIEPDYGVMFDDVLFRDGARVPARRFIKPRLETKLAFVMGADLTGRLSVARGDARNRICDATAGDHRLPHENPARHIRHHRR